MEEIGSCLLTGCALECCLEAAHVVPVKNGGMESDDNMILLRADMHRLFDSGLIALKLSDDGLCVYAKDGATYDYVSSQIGDRSAHARRSWSIDLSRYESAFRKRLDLQGSDAALFGYVEIAR